MKTRVGFSINALSTVLCLAALAPFATAGCGDISKLQAPFQFESDATTAAAARVAAAGGGSVFAPFATATPVGMWNIKFLAEGNSTRTPPIPDNVIVDFGYVQFHDDGTEIMNSGGHAPATQNFCLGVWVRTGIFTYEVNHFALSYDATSGALTTKVNIREQITLGPSGNQYTGTFTINVYDATSGSQVDHVVGNISATRVTVDQTQPYGLIPNRQILTAAAGDDCSYCISIAIAKTRTRRRSYGNVFSARHQLREVTRFMLPVTLSEFIP